MANIAHDKFASPSFQGNYDTYGVGPGDGTRWVGFTLEIGADNLGAGDIWKFVKLDSDTVVLGANLIVTDLDSNGTPALTLDLGYDLDSGTDDDNYWLENSTVGQAGGQADADVPSNVPYLFVDSDFMVQAKVETAAATAAAGTATCYLLLGNKNAH